MKKILVVICLLISSVITYFFAKDRKIGYDIIPDNKIFDERNYALQGFSIRESGIPIGWSDSGEYEHMPDTVKSTKLNRFSINVNETEPSTSNFQTFPKPVISVNEFDFGFGTQQLKFVQPFVDHPPLGGLVYSLGIPKDATGFLDIKPEYYRKVSLYLAILTSTLIFFFALQVFNNPWISVLSVATYNFVPSYLLITRYALLENVVAPLSLVMLNLLLLFIKHYRKNKKLSLVIILSGIIAGLTILAKESGIAFLIAGTILLLYHKIDKRYLIYYLTSAFIPLLVYFGWGLWLSPTLFKGIFLFNSQRRFLGPLNFINIFSFEWFKNFKLDGWWIWGFISLFFVYYYERTKAINFLIPFISGFIIILFLAGLNFPWYFFSLVPYLAIASGYSLWKIVISPDPVLLTTFFVFPLSSSLHWGSFVWQESVKSNWYRLIMFIYLLASTTRLLLKKNILIKLAWIVLSIFVVILLTKLNHQSIIYIITNWGNIKFPDFPSI